MRACLKRLFLFFSFLVCTVAAYAQPDPTHIYGTVHEGSGSALPYVNVVVEGTVEGAATNSEGAYSFTTRRTGPMILVVSMIGYEPVRKTIQAAPGGSIETNFVLRETLINMEEAVVTALAYATGTEETATLQPLEVVTTAGAAADILLAIKTFPGTAMVDEGAGLFVRGGDVNETVLFLDQATVTHPYKYESPTGGVFGTIPPFLVDGTYFSAGGFSAKYGNALSGVLAMESQDLPSTESYNLNLGLAAASAGFALPLIPGKLGVRFSGNRSFTGLLMEINRIDDAFVKTPEGWDGNLSAIYAYSSSGQIKWFNFSTSDRLGVRVDEPSFDAVYESDSVSRLHNLQWTDVYGNWLIQLSASTGAYRSNRTMGVLDAELKDSSSKLRLDLEREPEENERFRFFTGAEVERLNNGFKGTLPARDDILDPNAASYPLESSDPGTRFGSYGEVEWKWTRRIAARMGLRVDKWSLNEQWSADPRVSLRYAIHRSLNLRVAWGLYHQYARPYQYNASVAASLTPQRAQHIVAGIHYNRNALLLRLEGYLKPYDDLVLENDTNEYVNAGKGRAKGLDAFLKYGGFLQTRINGWISYSYLTSERTQLRHAVSGAVFEEGPSPFDISHNLTLVAKARVVGFWSTGFTFRYATGRPITPIVGASLVEEQGYYLPLEGPVGSERLPAFQRLDANLSYYLPFGQNSSATFYFAVSNVLNRANVLGYNYSPDYRDRSARQTNYRRSIYFGVSLNLNRLPR